MPGGALFKRAIGAFVLPRSGTACTHVEKYRLVRRRKENLVAYRTPTPRAGHYVCADVLLVVAVRCRVRGDALPAVWCSGY